LAKKLIMQLDLLLTNELRVSMPDTIKILHNFGRIGVIFPSKKIGEADLVLHGDSVVVEGEKDEVVKWLKPFDGIPVGCGSPQLERFTIMHIDENL